MAVKDYSGSIATAKRLIDKYGRAVTYQRRSVNEIDPLKPWLGVTQRASQALAVFATFIEFEHREIDNEIIMRGDKRCLLAAADFSTFRPDPGDEILDGTVTWSILNVKTIQPGSLDVLYDVHVRA